MVQNLTFRSIVSLHFALIFGKIFGENSECVEIEGITNEEDDC